jgi:hypothetical protein
MSMLGFAGDIFSGRWEDSKYVAENNAEYREAEKAAKPPEPKISEAQFDELGDLILETKTDQVKFNQAMKIETLSQLPASKFDHAKMLLEKKRSLA